MREEAGVLLPMPTFLISRVAALPLPKWVDLPF
jgi:hypothetical protein